MSEMNEQQPMRETTRAKWWVVALVVASGCGSILYRVLIHQRLGQSAAMFLGIPVVLAFLLAMAPTAKTVTGGIMKGITFALLIVAPMLGEGYLCILMASPLFYVVGVVVGLVVDYVRVDRTKTLGCVALVLLPMCLEGTTSELSVNRAETVQAVKVVDAGADAVEGTLARSPRVKTVLPRFLRIGFPRPLEAHGEGLNVGAMRTIHFAGAEGDPPGDLVMRVTERRPGYVRFETVSDGSKLTQWIRWSSSEVEWRPVDATHTEVRWTVHFARQLDPSWYFTPWERMAVQDAAKYLIAANAQPAEVSR
jgi:hypothetical protein